MNWNKHSEVSEGSHALFGASQYAWLNYSEEKIMSKYYGRYIPMMGTEIHDYARQRIEHRIKMNKYDKNAMLNHLLEKGIPMEVIEIDRIIDNIIPYVNDSIGFRMSPEVILKYSDYFFGTTDAISFRNNKLKIFDLKTGVEKAHMQQLLIYASLFCLEYKIKPSELEEIELRIYQLSEIEKLYPTAEDIVPIMDKIISMNKMLINIKE